MVLKLCMKLDCSTQSRTKSYKSVTRYSSSHFM